MSDYDVAAVGKGDHCYRCGGLGHIASDCPTPKGKGKGREDKAFHAKGGKGQEKGKGKGFGGKGPAKGKGKGEVVCSYCGKRGHDASRCWTLHPEQLPWKAANALEESGYHSQYDGGEAVELSVCCLECNGVGEAWETVRRKGTSSKASLAPVPPGLKVNNRFEQLMDSLDEEPIVPAIGGGASLDLSGSGGAAARPSRNVAVREEQPRRERERVQDVAGIDVLMPERVIAGVGRTERLKPAGRGKVTIDSGAAESVMPRGMLDKEPLVEGEAKRLGVRYVAANGSKMDNYGEKRARFGKEGLEGISNMLFQVTDVGKPLASVARILDKGNTVVFSRSMGGSYIVNDRSGRKIPLVEEKGTFVMEVEYLEPDAENQGFAGQGK